MPTRKATTNAEPSMFESGGSPSARALNAVATLANLLLHAEKHAEECDKRLKQANEHVRRLKEDSIPGAMEEAGVMDLTLNTGEKIKCSLEVYAQIPAAMKDQVMRWLEENGHDGIIKTEVTVNYGKGQTGAAKILKWLLQDESMEEFISQQIEKLQSLKDESEEAREERLQDIDALVLLRDTGFNEVALDRSIHAQTLKAFLKEQLRKDKVDVPLELFGARPVLTAKVSR